MPRYPRVSDTPQRFDAHGNVLCRNCEALVAENRKHYCSERCLNEFNRNNTWMFVRSDVLRRDGFRCCICEKRFRKADLQVDHIIPLRMGGQPFDKANLRTLCRACHVAKSGLDREALR